MKNIALTIVAALLLPGHAPAFAAGDPAPAAYAAVTLDGARFDLAAHRGRWIVVNFWATWCKPCREEIPALDALHRARDDVTVLGLAYEEAEPATILAFLERYPASYPMALVDVYEPPAAFGVPRVLPTTVLLTPAGLEARRFVGPVTREELEAAIAQAAGDG